MKHCEEWETRATGKKNINRNKASVSEGVGTQRGAVECRQEMEIFCTCSSSERPHCTAGQNQPKLDSRAKECHCLPFTVASLPVGLCKTCSRLPWLPDWRLLEGKVSAYSCSILLSAWHLWNSQRVLVHRTAENLAAIIRDAPTSLPQFPICKMGTVKYLLHRDPFCANIQLYIYDI